MVVAHCKLRLFIGAALDFGEELGKFVVAAQLETPFRWGRNTSKFLSWHEFFASSAPEQGLTKRLTAFILHGSLNRFRLGFLIWN
jgi:hypothetical protein